MSESPSDISVYCIRTSMIKHEIIPDLPLFQLEIKILFLMLLFLHFSFQSRCSIFRGTILSLCMNLTYANMVRFPRELERHGIVFLVPYLILMIFIGIPIVFLEIAMGQFLGQGAANSWKASPFFKGASLVARFASWLSTIWISMQMSLALVYIGQMSFSTVPFRSCAVPYEAETMSGQSCLSKTFLRPVWDYSVSFGLLAIGLVFLWVIVMMW